MFICKTLQSVRTIAQEPAFLSWILQGLFMDIFLEASDQLLSLIWSLSEDMKILNENQPSY
jgi:O-methyltransferase involved in polyketide biosynthesis